MNIAIDCGYHGKVGALFQDGKYFILSPNMDYIPEPANNPHMTFKYNGRLGDDDPLLWPQPYVEEICHFPVILRNQDPADSSTAVLYNSYREDYFIPIEGTLSGLGVLCANVVKQLKTCLESCKRLHQENEDNPGCSKTRLGAQLTTTVTHGIGHLERLPMSRKQQRFIFCQQQRCLSEFSAMNRYVSTHQARMNSTVVDMEVVKNPVDAVGAFFINPTHAHLYWKTGIPVWLVCPAHMAGTIRIDRLVDTIKAQEVLVVEEDPRDHRGVFFSGTSHGMRKYNFFNKYTCHYLSGSNPFSVNSTAFSFGALDDRPVSSASPSSRAPSSATISSVSVISSSAHGVVRPDKSKAHNRSEPCKLSCAQFKTYSMTASDPKPKSNSTPGSSGRNKFLDLTGPLAPPSIEAWPAALLAVDTAPSNRSLQFKDSKNGYAYPDPALFINVQTDAKCALYFANWLRHRTALIFRVSTPTTDTSPIGNQLWRTLLGLPLEILTNDATTRETKSAKRKQAIRDILANCVNPADGVSINPEDKPRISWQGMDIALGVVPSVQVARQILWEISELNFRCEFAALDNRAHDSTLSVGALAPPTSLNTPLPAPLTREELLGRCFVGSSMLDVQLAHANQGLASPLWTERRNYLVAFYHVVVTWTGFQSYATSKSCLDLSRPLVVPSDLSENDTCQLETLVTGFYTQMFFNFFGRAAIIPRRI